MKFNYNLLDIILSNINNSSLNSLKINNTTLLEKSLTVRIKRENLYPYSLFIQIDKDKYKITDLIEMDNGNIAASYTDGHIKIFSHKSPFKLMCDFIAHNDNLISLCNFKDTLISYGKNGFFKFWVQESKGFKCVKAFQAKTNLPSQVLCTNNGDIIRVSNKTDLYNAFTFISLFSADNDYQEVFKHIENHKFNTIHLLDNDNLCIIFIYCIKIFEVGKILTKILDGNFCYSNMAGLIPKNCVYECKDENDWIVFPYYSELFESTRKANFFRDLKILMRLRDERYIIQLKSQILFLFDERLKPIKSFGVANHITSMIKLKNDKIVISIENELYILK
jgi:hypothetical protein